MVDIVSNSVRNHLLTKGENKPVSFAGFFRNQIQPSIEATVGRFDPAAICLFGTALIGLVGISKRRKAA
jgi:hypothetical protein